MDRTRLGRELKWLRSTLGYNQSEMAERLGVAQSTYSKWENGKLVPSIHDLVNLAPLAGSGLGTLLRLLGFPIEDQALTPGQWLDHRNECQHCHQRDRDSVIMTDAGSDQSVEPHKNGSFDTDDPPLTCPCHIPGAEWAVSSGSCENSHSAALSTV